MATQKAKKNRLASLGFNVREARPFLGLCPANAPRRPAGVAKDIALLPLKDRAKPRYPTRKGALWRTLIKKEALPPRTTDALQAWTKGALPLWTPKACSLGQIMGKRPPCFNLAREEGYTITLYFFIIIRYKKDDVFGLPLLNGLVYM